MGLLNGLLLTGILAASLLVSLLITVPLTGALVRVRGVYYVHHCSRDASSNHAFPANYNPRGLQLDAEGNIEPHTGPVVTSFFGMLARVKRIEVSCSAPPACIHFISDPSQGWAGLYKGIST